jgi:glutamine synthetase
VSEFQALREASRVRVEFPDVNGVLRGKQVPTKKVVGGKAVSVSDVLYCLTSCDDVFENPDFTCYDTGWPDILIVPDWETGRPVPWNPGVAAVLGDARTKAGEPVPMCPRHVLRQAVDRLAALGLTSLIGVEYELFLFHDDPAGRQALREGRTRDLTPLGQEWQAYSLIRWPELHPLVEDIFAMMPAYGVPLDAVSTELGYGMIEVATSPLPPLQAADAAARLKLGVKELARRHGLIASFIAKWDMDQSGSSGHLHCSLLRDDENALWAGQGQVGELAAAALAGLLETAIDVSAFMSPFPNSYRRYREGTWAPLNVSWAHDNRNACIRYITVSPDTTRFEHRRPGADLHPYLSVAAVLDGCAHGIEQQLALRAEAPGKAWVEEAGPLFPTSLPDAIERLAGSAFARARYGDAFVDHYVLSRRAEQDAWAAAVGAGSDLEAAQVPDAETRRFLELV